MPPPASRTLQRSGLLSALLALLLPVGHGLATPPAIREGRKAFTMVGTDEGLASGAVVCMAQDRAGFLWMGSENGLMRYEGKGSRLYAAEDGLPSSSIIRLEPDPGGGLWAATLRGLVRMRDGVFERIQVGGRPYTQSASLLAMDRRGRLWTYTFDGLVRQRADLDFESLGWRPEGSVYAMAAGPVTGSVYVASQGGLTVFREDGGRETWGIAMGLPPQGVMLVAEDGQGRVWVGTGRVLLVLEPGEKRFKDASSRLPAPISPNGHAYLDRDGSVWIPTQNGIFQVDGERLDAAHGLPFRWVRSLYRDREGDLWVMGAGLARLLGQGRVVAQGSPGEVVWYMLRDARGRMMAATDNGVFVLDAGSARPLPGTAGWRIKGMALGPDGTLWMVNTRGPTLWLRPGAAAAVEAPLGEMGTGANSVYTDKAGRVFLGHVLKGLLRFDPGSGRLVQEVPPAVLGARAYGVYEMHEDGEGRLWAGADGGILIRGRDGGWRFHREPSGHRVRSIALLPDGTAWITGDEPKGLAHVRATEGALEVLERRTRGWGLASNMVYAVRRDAKGALWASTDKGVDCLEPPLHLGRHAGLVSEDCSVSALLAEQDVLWVGTSGG
ncbi:MAG TPA: two-component regulator propeller domain-containing protein, partial [Holophaga sp.]|nr:two-component regulator propeller domain-containing protein [Holophaga sp.]